MLGLILLIIAIVVVIIIYSGDNNANYIKKLVRQTARWAFAAAQDEHITVAIIHANYAIGYWSALQEIATPDEIERETGINFLEFDSVLKEIQDNITKQLIKECKIDIKSPQMKYLAHISGR